MSEKYMTHIQFNSFINQCILKGHACKYYTINSLVIHTTKTHIQYKQRYIIILVAYNICIILCSHRHLTCFQFSLFKTFGNENPCCIYYLFICIRHYKSKFAVVI